jgi:hypothetical protein
VTSSVRVRVMIGDWRNTKIALMGWNPVGISKSCSLGFESELRTILAFITAEGIRNVVWLATDVHSARLLRYEPGSELAGLVFHEFIAGPANAGSLPPGPLSRTFAPIELFARGRGPDPARPSFFNFGLLRIAADGLLRVEIRDADGFVPQDAQGRPGSLTLVPAR